MQAIVAVTSSAPAGGDADLAARTPVDAVEVFIIDCSDCRGNADVTLRLWTPTGTVVRHVKQVSPMLRDLTEHRTATDNMLVGDYPTGTWGHERREYHICVEVTPRGVGQEMLAGRVQLMTKHGGGETLLGTGRIRAIWTDEEDRSTRIDPLVAHHTGRAALAAAIKEGMDARASGDLDAASALLRRATALAAESGQEETLAQLRRVTRADTDTGEVRALAIVVDAVGDWGCELGPTKTVRAKKYALGTAEGQPNSNADGGE
ncbi:hypothetical protein [Catenulispora sp. MAP12-49]|uniref:hypothetical protein n=1 Tax=Catenulispora sp. MAP12-49 TaxID=3156302 RepID=UPI003513D8A5